jgi:uncharacterized FlaG/YvyC family protein
MIKKPLLINIGLFLASFIVINIGMYFFLKATQPRSVTGIVEAPVEQSDSVAVHADVPTNPVAEAVAPVIATESPAASEPPVQMSESPSQGALNQPMVSSVPQMEPPTESVPVTSKEPVQADIQEPEETPKTNETELKEQAKVSVQAAASGDLREFNKLAKLLDSMKPKDAAAIASELDTDAIVSLIMKMKDRNAAKMMAALPPQLAARIASKMSEMATVAGRKL